MAAYEQQVRRHPSKPKSPDQLDAWMAAAVSVLRGSDAGEKRVKMDYKWVNHTRIVDGRRTGELEDVERHEDHDVAVD